MYPEGDIISIANQRQHLPIGKRGGKRKGAGRPPEGKAALQFTLTAANVIEAKAREGNFSGLLDRLLARWLGRSG
jgi:hypothetical protein